MSKTNFHFSNEDYFPFLTQRSNTAIVALEYFVDDLHTNKEEAIRRFLSHHDLDSLLWNLFWLLTNADQRISGNSAYIIGTVAETDNGIEKILELLVEGIHVEKTHVLAYLVNMLKSNDIECLMNAAGTIGTILENVKGREWLLTQSSLDEVICLCTNLLDNQHMWISSNAALVLARISIEDSGCTKILSNACIDRTIKNLIDGLNTDNIGRAMNCAFTIGRLCGNPDDLDVFMKYNNEKSLKKLIGLLSTIVEQNLDYGLTKNSCFALSCLVDHKPIYNMIVHHTAFDGLANSLANRLGNVDVDVETQCYASMLLRILASSVHGCIKLRSLSIIESIIKTVLKRNDLYVDVERELRMAYEYLRRLEKPNKPIVESIGSTNIHVKWDRISWKTMFKLHVQYALYVDNNCVYIGAETSYDIQKLLPYTEYALQLGLLTIEDDDSSELSEPLYVTTDEDMPSEPLNVRCVGSTMSLIKVTWDPPDTLNGLLKAYFVYKDGKYVDQTSDLMCIVAGLAPSTSYDISVCAATSKGKGPRATTRGSTCDMGDVTPDRPTFGAIGRREVMVRWCAPKSFAGKLNHYDLLMNNKCLYSGMNLDHQVIMLRPDTEYKFEVVAITNEGKFKSKVSIVRTLKDEYNPERTPLYHANKRVQDLHMPLVTNKTCVNNKRMSANKQMRSLKNGLLDVDVDPYVNIVLPPVQSKQFDEKTLNGKNAVKRYIFLNNHQTVRKLQIKPSNGRLIAQLQSNSQLSTNYSPSPYLDGRISRNNYVESTHINFGKTHVLERSKTSASLRSPEHKWRNPAKCVDVLYGDDTNTDEYTETDFAFIDKSKMNPLVALNLAQLNSYDDNEHSKPVAIISSSTDTNEQKYQLGQASPSINSYAQFYNESKILSRQKSLYLN